LFLHGCFLVETFIDPLDIEKIAAHIYFRPQIVEQCIHETLLLYAGGLLDNQDVEFFFKGIGILTVRRRVVTMNYYTDFLLDVDDTRNMREALLTVSGSCLQGSLQLWQCCQSSLKLLSPCLPHHWVRQAGGATQTVGSTLACLCEGLMTPKDKVGRGFWRGSRVPEQWEHLLPLGARSTYPWLLLTCVCPIAELQDDGYACLQRQKQIYSHQWKYVPHTTNVSAISSATSGWPGERVPSSCFGCSVFLMLLSCQSEAGPARSWEAFQVDPLLSQHFWAVQMKRPVCS